MAPGLTLRFPSPAPVALLVALVSLGACGKPPTPTPPAPTVAWEPIFEGLPGALLSITGTSEKDLYAVGADTRDGKGALFLHWDGATWKRIPTSFIGDLWWISKIGERFWLSGTKGTVLTYVPSTGAVATVATPGADVTLFGIWGNSEADVWAVGGNLEKTGPASALWRFDGSKWTVQKAPDAIEGKTTIFKVFGLGASDVYLCGATGIVGHFDGTAWSVLSSGVEDSMFTIHASPGLQVAVGGFASAVVLEKAGAGFKKVSGLSAQRMNGVFVTSATDAIAVGVNGDVLRRSSEGWKKDASAASNYDLHAVWVDPKGEIWAVGGDLASTPLRKGTLVHFGAALGPATLPGN